MCAGMNSRGGGSKLKTPDSVNQSPEDSVHIAIVIELQSDERKSPLGTGNVWPEIQEALSGAKDQSPPAAQSVKSEWNTRKHRRDVNITLSVSCQLSERTWPLLKYNMCLVYP